MFKKILAFMVMLYAVAAMAAVDVNKATEAQLDSVKGIGPITSRLILSERKKGEFKSWEDFIDRVKGVGDGRAAKLSAEGLTVNGAAFKGAAAGKKDDKKDAKADAKAKKESEKQAKMDAEKKKADDAKAKSDAGKMAKDAKPAASAAKPAASAAKPAASVAKPAASAKK